MNIRPASFSGSWYPARREDCEKEIRSFLDGFDPVRTEKGRAPVGGIAPHAGWYFSGKIACRVIRRLGASAAPDMTVVFGMHLHPASPAVLMAEGAWETPFGPLDIAHEAARELAERHRFQLETPSRFSRDNTIELQLPFIKYFFPDTRILPIGAPPSEAAVRIAESVAAIAKESGLTMAVIGSTDLTHYGYNYGFTPKGTGPEALHWVTRENDRRFIEAVLTLDPARIIREGLENHNACCAGAAAAAVTAAKALGAVKGEALAYATSHDRHPDDSFVGYAGILLE